jgi:hypothetical protein
MKSSTARNNKGGSGRSTDVGDVSFIVPEISLQASTAPLGAPVSLVVVACGGMSIGRKSMLFAASTGYDNGGCLPHTRTANERRVPAEKG